MANPVPSQPPLVSPQSNPAGLIALIVGVVGLLLGYVFTQVQALVIMSGGYDAIAGMSIARSVLALLLGLVALALGIVGITRKGRRHSVAVAGLTLGAVLVADFVSSALYSLISNFASI